MQRVTVNNADRGEVLCNGDGSLQRARCQNVVRVQADKKLSSCLRQTIVERLHRPGIFAVDENPDPFILISKFSGHLHTIIGRRIIYDDDVHTYI